MPEIPAINLAFRLSRHMGHGSKLLLPLNVTPELARGKPHENA